MTHTNLSEVERSSGNCFYDVTFETVCTQKNSINPLIYTNLMSHDFRTRVNTEVELRNLVKLK